MSTFDSPDGIGDRGEFTDALSSLIEAAESNDVEIEGGYKYDGEDGASDYGIEIFRVVDRQD